MNLGEMTAYIVKVIQDSSFDPVTDIHPMINAALLKIAAEDKVRLPDLITTNEVTFTAGGSNSQALPENYHHNLFEVKDLSGKSIGKINIRTSSQILHHLYGPDPAQGPIQDVAVDGALLWAMPEILENQTLQIRYYRKPAELAADDHVPEGIPEHLHEGTIVNRVLAKIYNLIEEDVNDPKVNTRLYLQKYATEGLAPLRAFCKGVPRKRPVVKRHAGWF